MENRIRIIGLSGKLQSGKDTVAEMIQRIMPDYWKVKKFAGKLKEMVSLLTGINVEDLERIEIKNSSLGPDWNDMTVRTMLQKLGTEAIRQQIHQNAWVNALFAEYDVWFKRYSAHPNWIITDLRFPNEAEAIKKRGGILIRVVRPGKENTGDHPSETSLDNYNDWNHVINNDGTLLDLYDKIDGLMQPIIYQTIK